MEPRVFIIVINWNSREVTSDCLRSLLKIDYGNCGVIVVDNGSTDGSPDEIKRSFPEVILIRNRENLGFDGGNNVGIRRAIREGAEAVLLLNNDTVVDPAILRVFASAASSLPRAGVLGPKIYYYDEPERIWWAGCKKSYSKTGWLLNYTQEGKNQIDRGGLDEKREIDAVIGCAMYIKTEVLKAVGLLDPRYFIYHEEHDFCRRVTRAGWKCYFVPGARVWHKISLSMGGEDSPSLYYLWTRNWLLLSRKQISFIFWPLVYFCYLRESYWIYQGLMGKGQQESADAVLAGVWYAIRNIFGPARSIKPPAWMKRVVEWDYRKRSGTN